MIEHALKSFNVAVTAELLYQTRDIVRHFHPIFTVVDVLKERMPNKKNKNPIVRLSGYPVTSNRYDGVLIIIDNLT